MVAANVNTAPAPAWAGASDAPSRSVFARLRHALRGAYADWREDGDEAAIARALSSLSARQLSLLGMRHATLPCDVRALVDRVRHHDEIAREVLDILDRSEPLDALPAPARLPARASAPRRRPSFAPNPVPARRSEPDSRPEAA